ncbi:hypothetical protein BH09PAT4_BH09PAT4_04480 [soil metagenome]
MQDDVKPNWDKKPKPDTTIETPAEPQETSDTESTDGNTDQQAPQPADDVIDEKKIEEEFGPAPDPVLPEETMKQPIHKRPWAWLKGMSKKRKLLYGSLLLLIVATIAVCLVLLNRPAPEVPNFPVYHAPTSTTVPSKLTGLQVDPAINKLQVTGVMIENSVFARPQSSLNQAGVVYEAIAEAGITRFLALFQDTQSDHIGPVRSARPYYVQWCQAFDCALAHVGGSPEALKDIKTYHVKNLDQFAGSSYFHRVNSRYAPHNMYTSQAQLTNYEKSRGYKESTYTGFEHLVKEPEVASTSVTTTSINFNYPGSSYDVHYDYQVKTNDYARSEGGKAHMSADSQGKLHRNTPKVVIALVIPYSLKGDGYHSNYNSVGTGTLYLFQNGTVTKGTWTRKARDSQFVLTDTNGKALQLVPGQTWISVQSSTSDVTYK